MPNVKGIYDGRVIHPSEPLGVPPNTEVIIQVDGSCGEDVEARFRGALGAWKDIDADALIRDISRSRKAFTRTPPAL